MELIESVQNKYDVKLMVTSAIRENITSKVTQRILDNMTMNEVIKKKNKDMINTFKKKHEALEGKYKIWLDEKCTEKEEVSPRRMNTAL